MTSDRSADYLAAHRAVSSLLYEFDPFAMGASIDAPMDEYDDLAARLMVAVKSSTSLADASASLARSGWSLGTELEKRIWQVLDEADLHAK